MCLLENSQRSIACLFGRHTGYAEEITVNPRLVKYTFLTPKTSTHRPNVYAGRKGQILKGFSNVTQDHLLHPPPPEDAT